MTRRKDEIREEYSAWKKVYDAAYYVRNRDTLLAKAAAYRVANQEKIVAYAAAHREEAKVRDRARKLEAKGGFNVEQLPSN